jgi:hypothetical protein
MNSYVEFSMINSMLKYMIKSMLKCMPSICFSMLFHEYGMEKYGKIVKNSILTGSTSKLFPDAVPLRCPALSFPRESQEEISNSGNRTFEQS